LHDIFCEIHADYDNGVHDLLRLAVGIEVG
jgi:hypothetical protein